MSFMMSILTLFKVFCCCCICFFLNSSLQLLHSDYLRRKKLGFINLISIKKLGFINLISIMWCEFLAHNKYTIYKHVYLLFLCLLSIPKWEFGLLLLLTSVSSSPRHKLAGGRSPINSCSKNESLDIFPLNSTFPKILFYLVNKNISIII